jgi:threonylcarbamoyladenosine tRNA methylthiotransferase MtaB
VKCKGFQTNRINRNIFTIKERGKKMAKVAFHTLGCKVNQYETEGMMTQFEKLGYDVVGFFEKADIYVINTCTVTNMADKKSRQMLAKAKKNNPKSLVVAVGCYVQASNKELLEMIQVDLLIGNTDKGNVVQVIETYLESKTKPKILDLSQYKVYDDLWISMTQDHTRAHIKIQDGCDQFCTYCIIPYARGRIRSRSVTSILEECKELAKKGYKEVVLTGIHLASYGIQFDDYKLIDLLEDIQEIEGILRIRLGSLEPTLITQDFVSRVEKLDKVCPHFHLSMQSGNDVILKKMNRKYTTVDYKRAVDRLREKMPTCAITTDLIVGFPSETEAQFEDTLIFIKDIGFANMHIFKYSKRNGTPAAKMKEQVNPKERNIRSTRAIEMAENMKEVFLTGFIDVEMEVLIEEEVILDHQIYYVGHTTNHIKVYTMSTQVLEKNTIKKIHLKQRFEDGLLGSS